MRIAGAGVRIIPVLDVMNGVVVRAVGGRRSEYRPIMSRLTDSTEPLAVAKALLTATGASELYVADLDAITGECRFSAETLRVFREATVTNWVDVGLRRPIDVQVLPEHRGVRLIVGSETVEDLGVIGWAGRYGGRAHEAAFSIDLHDGVILGDWRSWGVESPRDVIGLAGIVLGRGIRTMVLLDLAGVGVGQGPRTADTCRRIRVAYPRLEIITGGGVRNHDDIKRLEDAGADGVLVASALHDGTLP